MGTSLYSFALPLFRQTTIWVAAVVIACSPCFGLLETNRKITVKKQRCALALKRASSKNTNEIAKGLKYFLRFEAQGTKVDLSLENLEKQVEALIDRLTHGNERKRRRALIEIQSFVRQYRNQLLRNNDFANSRIFLSVLHYAKSMEDIQLATRLLQTADQETARKYGINLRVKHDRLILKEAIAVLSTDSSLGRNAREAKEQLKRKSIRALDRFGPFFFNGGAPFNIENFFLSQNESNDVAVSHEFYSAWLLSLAGESFLGIGDESVGRTLHPSKRARQQFKWPDLLSVKASNDKVTHYRVREAKWGTLDSSKFEIAQGQLFSAIYQINLHHMNHGAPPPKIDRVEIIVRSIDDQLRFGAIGDELPFAASSQDSNPFSSQAPIPLRRYRYMVPQTKGAQSFREASIKVLGTTYPISLLVVPYLDQRSGITETPQFPW